jgi:electron transfer flavoprotein beta subunit
MRVVVCMKQVPDPEGPASSFTASPEDRWVKTSGLPPVISPFDENALEAAVLIKEATGATVTLLSVAESHSKPVLLKALAVGADDAVLVEGPGLDARDLDSFATASILAAAIRDMGEVDLVLTGRQASDTNAGAVGLGVAQLLGIPAVSVARKIEVTEGKVRVERVLPDGYEIVEVPMPALVTVSHEVGELRYPALAAIKAAKQFPRRVLSVSDLEPGERPRRLTEIATVSAPDRERRCVMVAEEDPAGTGARLARLLRDDGVI